MLQEQHQKKIMAMYAHHKNALQNLRDQEFHSKRMKLIQLQIEKQSGRPASLHRNDTGATNVGNLDDFINVIT